MQCNDFQIKRFCTSSRSQSRACDFPYCCLNCPSVEPRNRHPNAIEICLSVLSNIERAAPSIEPYHVNSAALLWNGQPEVFTLISSRILKTFDISQRDVISIGARNLIHGEEAPRLAGRVPSVVDQPSRLTAGLSLRARRPRMTGNRPLLWSLR